MTVSSQKTANSLFWSGVESGSLAVLSLASLIVYSRLLSEAEFGLFSIVLAITELLSILVTMMFHDALVQRRQVSTLYFDTAFSVTMATSLVLVLICWGAAPLFARIVHQPNSDWILASTAMVFPCLGLSATIVAQQRRAFAFKSLAVRSLLGRVAGAVSGITAAFLGAGVWSLVIQQLVTAFVGSLVLWISAERAPRFRFGNTEFGQLMSFGVFSVTSTFLAFSTKRLFTIIAGLLLGVATAGFLNLSFRVVDVLWAVLATAVSQVALPMLSGLQSDPERLKRAYQKAVAFACLSIYPCFVGIAVVAPEIVETLFGARWSPAVPVIVALSCLTLVQAPRLYVSPMLTALGRPRDTLAGVVAEFFSMLFAAAALGMPSLAWAVAIWIGSQCIQAPISVILLRRAAGYSILEQFAGVKTPLTGAIVLALVVALTRELLPATLGPQERLVVLSSTGAVAYVGAVFVFDRQLAVSFLTFVRSALHRSPL